MKPLVRDIALHRKSRRLEDRALARYLLEIRIRLSGSTITTLELLDKSLEVQA